MNNLRLALRLGVVATTLAALATASVVAPIVLLPVLDADAACTVTVKILPNTRSNSAPCLETRLIGLGYSNIGKPSLLYGAASVRAVKQFQMQRGLYPDGIVTSITARELGLRGPLPTSPSTARVTIIGDSTSAAMRWYDEANDRTTIYDVMGGAYDLVWSLESCRRLVATSCVGRVDPGTGGQWRPVSVLPLMQTSLKGRLGQALVVTAGYDDRDIGTAIEQVMHEAIAQGVPSVFWLTYRTSTTYGYGGYYRQHNAQLAAAAARYPSLRVLDWNAYSHSLPTATQRTWFEKDDVHMTRLGGTGLATWLKHRLAPGHIERCVAATARAGSPATAVGVPAVATTQPGGFQSVAPTRVLDTRVPGLGGGAGALAADQMLTIDLSAALPVDTQSVVLDVVAVHPCQAGVLTVFACGPRPAIGTIALAGSRTAAALAISQVSAGKVCISTTATTDLVIDLEGAFVPGGARFHPVTPRRFLNSRPGISTVTIAGPLTAPRDVTVQVTGNGGVPLDATGAWFNVAAVRATTESALGMSPGPCGTPNPTSAINVLAGRSTGNGVLVGLGADGSVCLHAGAGSVDIALDLAGWFGGSDTGGLEFQQSAPRWVVGGSITPVVLHPGTPLPIASTSVGVYAITTSRSASVGSLSARPCGTTTPAYLLTPQPNESLSNLAALAPAADEWCLSSAVTTAVVAALVGTFTSPPV